MHGALGEKMQVISVAVVEECWLENSECRCCSMKVIFFTGLREVRSQSYLSDLSLHLQVTILSQGKVKALGTPLSLKHKHGTGFRLCFNTVNEEQRQKLIIYIRRMLPNAKLLVAAGTCVVVGVPRTLAAVLPKFFGEIEEAMLSSSRVLLQHDGPHRAVVVSEMNLDGERPVGGGGERVAAVPGGGGEVVVVPRVAEFSISNATLDEVFLKLTKDDRAKFSLAGAQEEEEEVFVCSLCGAADTECVWAFTKGGAAFMVDGVICRRCAEGETEAGRAAGVSTQVEDHEQERTQDEIISSVVVGSTNNFSKNRSNGEGEGGQLLAPQERNTTGPSHHVDTSMVEGRHGMVYGMTVGTPQSNNEQLPTPIGHASGVGSSFVDVVHVELEVG